MKTKRLISTIAYNTDMFLGSQLSRFVESGIIEWAHWIRHQPEDDEKKSHVHLIVQPSKQLDTSDFSREFYEIDSENAGKLLCPQPWRFSKLEDWLLYSLHDLAYLSTKGLERKFHYRLQDVCSTCPDLLKEQYGTIDLRAYGLGKLLQDHLEQGKTWEYVLRSGHIPPMHWRYWRAMWFAMGGTSVEEVSRRLQ